MRRSLEKVSMPRGILEVSSFRVQRKEVIKRGRDILWTRYCVKFEGVPALGKMLVAFAYSFLHVGRQAGTKFLPAIWQGHEIVGCVFIYPQNVSGMIERDLFVADSIANGQGPPLLVFGVPQ